MIAAFDEWASSNPDAAYLVGFSIIVAGYHGLMPYKLGLDVATTKGIPFIFIVVAGQIRKPHRIALSAVASLVFAFFHFAIAAPLGALVMGCLPMVALTITDYRQMARDNAPRN